MYVATVYPIFMRDLQHINDVPCRFCLVRNAKFGCLLNSNEKLRPGDGVLTLSSTTFIISYDFMCVYLARKLSDGCIAVVSIDGKCELYLQSNNT